MAPVFGDGAYFDEDYFMNITVFGTGYLGAVHAVGMAAVGHHVMGVDVDTEKITALAAGRAPFYEPGFAELLRQALDTGRLRFTTSVSEAAQFGRLHFVCVGTPQQTGGLAADLSGVHAVVDALASQARRDCLIVGKSTVPVGTAQALQSRVDARSAAGVEISVAWNPEFLREGFAVQDTLSPDRLVFGIQREQDEQTLRAVYVDTLSSGTPCVVTDLPTAELVKVAANSFLATKISFINAMSEICEATGGDVVTLADAIGYDERIGRRFLNAGLGFGGGCLGKDIRAFRARADELGLAGSLDFLVEVDRINDRRRQRVLDVARDEFGDLGGLRVAALGATFKPNSDDVRDSPSLDVARRLARAGAQVRVHDPAGLDNARLTDARRTDDPVPAGELVYVDALADALVGADLVVLLTEWDDYRRLDPVTVRSLTGGSVLIDARNALDLDRWARAGWTVRGLGRTIPQPTHIHTRAVAAEVGISEEFVA